MVRLEPGDEALDAVGLSPPEPQEGVHLVQVAGDGLAHPVEPMDQRVASHLHQAAFTVRDAPDQGVEQGVALGVAVRDDHADQVGHRARQA